MAINNKVWTTGEKCTSVGLNQMSQDANNTADDIHTQYPLKTTVVPQVADSIIQIQTTPFSWEQDNGAIDIYQYMDSFAGYDDVADYSDKRGTGTVVVTDGAAGTYEVWPVQGMSFLKGSIDNFDATTQHRFIQDTGSNVLAVSLDVYSLSPDGVTRTAISGGTGGILSGDAPWQQQSFSNVDISAVDADNIIVIQVRVTGTCALGTAVGRLFRNFVVTKNY